MTDDQGHISEATHETEEEDARVHAGADREPTPEEEKAAEAHGPVSESVIAHEEEMLDLGASVKGEGQIEPEG